MADVCGSLGDRKLVKYAARHTTTGRGTKGVFRCMFEQFATRQDGPYANLRLIGPGPWLAGGCIYLGSRSGRKAAVRVVQRCQAFLRLRGKVIVGAEHVGWTLDFDGCL